MGRYIIRSYTTGQVTKPTSVKTNEAFVNLELPTRGWEILSAFPLQSFKLERKHPSEGAEEIEVGNMGVLGKMIGAAAIVSSNSFIERSTGRLRVWTSLKILGTLGRCKRILNTPFEPKPNSITALYISDLKARSIENDFIALIFGQVIPSHCVKISDACENVLEIDTARAWKETDSNASVSTNHDQKRTKCIPWADMYSSGVTR